MTPPPDRRAPAPAGPVLGAGVLEEVDALLAPADRALASGYPGAGRRREPVHTVYVPADRATPGTARELGDAALEALDRHAPGPGALAEATGTDPALTEQVWPLLLAKLRDEPVEDLRLDLEDGYGTRPDAEEDDHAHAAAQALRAAVPCPPYGGIRFKSLEAATRRRGLRSLDLFLAGWCDARPPAEPTLRLTLPKVTSVDQVRAMVLVCARLEDAHGLPAGALTFEVQVETPQAVLGPDGTATAARVVHAAGSRCTGLHFGTYDYSAGLDLAPEQQALDHPAADHAKSVLQVAAAGTGVRVSDGSTNVLPVGDRSAVHAAWALHARLVTRSLRRGLYQGWDLHGAQLVTRYLATYAFYRAGLDTVAARLRGYVDRRAGGVLDEPATAAALAAHLLRGLECGALTDGEVTAAAGLGRAQLEDLRGRRPPAGGAAQG